MMEKQTKKKTINFVHPSKTEWKTKCMTLLHFLRKQWLSLTVWFITLVGSLVCFAMAETTRNSFAFENLYTSVTQVANARDAKIQNLTLSDDESNFDYMEFRSFVSRYDQHNKRGFPFSCFLSVSPSLNSESFRISSDGGKSLMEKTLISPKTFDMYENADGTYTMYCLPIKVLYSTFNLNNGGTFCVISNTYARQLMDEWNIENMQDLLGRNLDTYFTVNGGSKTHLPMYIGNIYHSTSKGAGYIQNVFDDFILAYTLNSRNVDYTNLTFLLGDSIIRNHTSLTMIFEQFSVGRFNYRFLNEKNSEIGYINLNQKLYDYVHFSGDNQTKYIGCLVGMGVCFLCSSFFLAKLSINNTHDKLLSHRRFARMIFIISFSVFVLTQLLSNYLFHFVSSDATMGWLFIFGLEMAYLMLFWLLSRKGGNAHETKNEVE